MASTFFASHKPLSLSGGDYPSNKKAIIIKSSSSQFRCFTPRLPSPIFSKPTRLLPKTAIRVCCTTAASSSIWPSVRKGAMEAIDMNRGRVLPCDVASRAGCNLNEAQKALQALAADTNGSLVSGEGDIFYLFPEDYRSKMFAKALWAKVQPLLELGKIAIGHTVKFCFITILFISSWIFSLQYKMHDAIRNFFSFCVGEKYESVGVKILDYPTLKTVLSCVFGDPDHSHETTEKERWKMIRQYITSKGGVVTAEELTPYLDLEANELMGDESYMLPVLLRLDGRPQLDEEGNILYCFPSLQHTATVKRSGREEYAGRQGDLVEEAEKFFKENEWQFRQQSEEDMLLAIAIGIVNLFVVILNSVAFGIIGVPRVFISLLQVHAVSFFAFFLSRWWFIQIKNAKIVERNQARKQRAIALESLILPLRWKLSGARNKAQRIFVSNDSSAKDCYAPA